jgi:hypothetical protein
MQKARRLAVVVLGVSLWIGGLVLLVEDRRILGTLLVLLGAVAVVLALVSDRREGMWETVGTWLSQLP